MTQAGISERRLGSVGEMTPDRLAELRRVAEAATPGPWRIPGANVFRVVAPETQNQGDPYYRWAVIADADPRSVDGEQAAANACYIAAFHPPTVLAMLDEIERLRRVVEAVRKFAVVAEQVVKAWDMDDDVSDAIEELREAALDYAAVEVGEPEFEVEVIEIDDQRREVAPMADERKRCPKCGSELEKGTGWTCASYRNGHGRFRESRPCLRRQLAQAQAMIEQLRDALRAALEWIDAVPRDIVLPTMPGFDRDWAESLLVDADECDGRENVDDA